MTEPTTPNRRGLLCLLVVCLAMASAAGADAPSRLDGVRLSLETGSPVRVVSPGSEEKLTIALHSARSGQTRGKVRVEVESFDGKPIPASGEVVLPSGRTVRWPMPKAALGRPGIKWVKMWFESGGTKTAVASASFAYMTPAGPAKGPARGFLFGMAYGASPDNYSETAALATALCGVKIVRGPVYWSRVQPKPDQWQWDGPDRILRAYGAHDIEVYPLLMSTPRWAMAHGPKSGKHFAKLDAWRAYLTRLAARYRGRFRYWEIWNEPDIDFFHGTTDEYRQMLRAAYGAVKAGDPDAKVMTGGFVSLMAHKRKPGMIETVIRQDQGHFDLLAYHTHGHFPSFRDEMDRRLLPYCRSVLKADRPLFFTETGMDTRLGERHQARTLPKKVVFAWSRGAVAYTWFNLHDMVGAEHPRQAGQTYGLFTKFRRIDEKKPWSPENVDYSGCMPKAAYVAYNTLIRTLRGMQYVEQLNRAPGEFAFLFEDDGKQVLVLWGQDKAATSRLVVATDARRAQLVDLMGHGAVAELHDGRVMPALGPDPSYLILLGGEKRPKVLGALARPTGEAVLIPGRPVRAAVDLWNPMGSEATVDVKWELPHGLVGLAEPRMMRIGANQRVRVQANCSLRRGTRASFGQVLPAGVTYRFRGLRLGGTLRIPVRVGALVVGTGSYPKAPSFRLNTWDHVVSLSEHDPYTAHLMWRGGADLNAVGRLMRDETGVTLRVLVRDNAFHQTGKGDLRKGDSVTVGLFVPGAGLWVWTAADGGAMPTVQWDLSPKGARAPDADRLVAIRADGSHRTYEIRMTEQLFGLTDKALAEGVRLNVHVHDNDGAGPKCRLQLAPGLTTPPEPKRFPLLVVSRKDAP